MDCKKRLAFNYIFYFSSTHASMPKHSRMPRTLNPWASWKRPTLGSVHIHKLCPIRSMPKLIVGFFSNPHCFLALLWATQLDTSPGLYAGLNTANCSISARSDSSLRCLRPFSSSAPPISRHMKIESFGTQAEGRDWEANRAGYSFPLPFGMINLQWERTLESFSWQDSPLALSGFPREERWMNASFFLFLQVQPYSHSSLTAHNRTVSTCPLPQLCILCSSTVSHLFTSQWQSQPHWKCIKSQRQSLISLEHWVCVCVCV